MSDNRFNTSTEEQIQYNNLRGDAAMMPYWEAARSSTACTPCGMATHSWRSIRSHTLGPSSTGKCTLTLPRSNPNALPSANGNLTRQPPSRRLFEGCHTKGHPLLPTRNRRSRPSLPRSGRTERCGPESQHFGPARPQRGHPPNKRAGCTLPGRAPITQSVKTGKP